MSFLSGAHCYPRLSRTLLLGRKGEAARGRGQQSQPHSRSLGEEVSGRRVSLRCLAEGRARGEINQTQEKEQHDELLSYFHIAKVL